MCMKKLFKQIDDFLNKCVDYFQNRIITGKFVGDIKYYILLCLQVLGFIGKKAFAFAIHSNVFSGLIIVLKTFLQACLKISLVEILVSFIRDTLKIIVICYSEIFIIFSLTFPTTILLLNWFQTSIITFTIGLIPILLLDIFCVSALYYCIDRRLTGDKVSIWKSFLAIFRHYYYFSLPIVTEAALMLESLLAFFIVTVFIIDIFNVLQISWGGSIIFWFIIVIFLLLLFIEFIVLTIIMYQTYFYVLLDHLPFQQALIQSRKHLKTYFTYDLIFFVALFFLLAFFSVKMIVTYFYLGLTISFFVIITSGTFLAFLFHRKFTLEQPIGIPNLKINYKTHAVFLIIVTFGFVNYILMSVLLVKEYQPLLAFVKQQEDNYLASLDSLTYENTVYHYSIQYPKAWTKYEWSDKSVTFYNNYTGTVSGGTWMTINVSSFNNNAFDPLYQAAPGLVLENGQTKDITTKITNMTIQGYDTVNYAFTKAGVPYSQFEIHYLIHKGGIVYDIAFISMTNDVANYNSDLFQKIISSFQFTQ
jgi:hypothetical protein